MRVTTLVAIFTLSSIVHCQEPQFSTGSAQRRETIADLKQLHPWPRIGSPPVQQSAASRAHEWQQEKATFAHAIEVLREDWKNPFPETPEDLRRRVREYEDMVRLVVQSGGYGNLLLADVSRRLSLTLLTRYLFKHLNEHSVIEDLLKEDRVRLLDCPALNGLVTEEIELAPPAGGWRLSESRENLEAVFRSATGSSYRDTTARMLFGDLHVSDLTTHRDLAGILLRLIGEESAERVSLAGFVEFLKRGGRLEDIRLDDVRPFLQVMQGEEAKFQFPPLGNTSLRAAHLDALVRAYTPRGRKEASFSLVIAE